MFARIWHGRLGGLRLIMLLAVLVLAAVGLRIIVATGRTGEFNKQLMWLALGAMAFVAINLFHYQHLGRISFLLYAGVLVSLVLVLIGKYLHLTAVVPVINGTTRWIKLLPFLGDSPLGHIARVQPSEIAKLTYILALAWYLRYRQNYRHFSGLVAPFVLTLVPMALILKQPDLGTVLLFLPVLFCVLFVAGARVKHLLSIIIIGLLFSPAFYFIMEEYQVDRIKAVFMQNSDEARWRNGPCFQTNRSKIYIALGQATGQAGSDDPFARHCPLPAEHNDFIFALIAYRWGFWGAVGVMALYALVIVGGVEIAAQQAEPFGRLLAVGISALLAVQMFINIGVTMGLMPPTGMNLPFVSYGGSSLLTNFLSIGLLVNIARRRQPSLVLRSFEFDD